MNNLRNNGLPSKGAIVIYQTKDREVKLVVKLEQETVWLTQAQIAKLFQTDRSVITKHLSNIFNSKELKEKSNVHFMHIAFSDKPVKLYNLDVVISIGYRVNSNRATQFRIWATKVLRGHILHGFTINQKRLLEQVDNFKKLQQTIAFISAKSQEKLLENQAQGLLRIINEYTKSLTMLEQYDGRKLLLHRAKRPRSTLKYGECKNIIISLKEELIKKKEASGLFGQESDRKFESIVANIYQTFGKKELYPSVEEKSAHLLYFVIKDHPFADGNKRIASILFIYFLRRNDYFLKQSGEPKINDNALVALALLIATSEPREKEIMIKIITNLLK